MSENKSEGEATVTIIESVAVSLRGEEFALGQSATIGRVSENEIVVPDREVSRHHAAITREAGQYYIEDLGSLNGTWLNDVRLKPNQSTPLTSGSEIRLGPSARLLFTAVGATVPANEAMRELLANAPLPGSAARRLRLDENRREVWFNGRLLDPSLSPVQYNLIRLLLSQPGRVFSRDEIAHQLWPHDERGGISDEAIDAVVKRVRERFAQIEPDQQIIVTVRAHGFKLG